MKRERVLVSAITQQAWENKHKRLAKEKKKIGRPPSRVRKKKNWDNYLLQLQDKYKQKAAEFLKTYK